MATPKKNPAPEHPAVAAVRRSNASKVKVAVSDIDGVLLPQPEPAAQMQVHAPGPGRPGGGGRQLRAVDRLHRGGARRQRPRHHQAGGPGEPALEDAGVAA